RREISIACPDVDDVDPLLNQPPLDRRQLLHRIDGQRADTFTETRHALNLAPGERTADAVHREEFLQLAPNVRPVAYGFGGGWQALQHRRPVAFGEDAPVQQYYGAHVGLAADQPAKSLFQLECGERHQIVREPVDARLGETLEPRGGQRFTRHLERQLGENQHAQRTARYVHAFPE